MILVDINLLLYAVNEDDPHHLAARDWLEQKLSLDDPVGLSWIVILGFVRLSTNAKVFPKPLSRQEALDQINSWLAQPCVRVIAAGDRHWKILNPLLRDIPHSPNWVTDAHLAALAIEHGYGFYSADNGFARFTDLQWSNPLQKS